MGGRSCPPGRRPSRWPAFVLVAFAVAGGGALLETLSRRASGPMGVQAPAAGKPVRTAGPVVADGRPGAVGGAVGDRAAQRALAEHFARGVAMLHAGRSEYAVVAFHEVLRIAPRLPEAHVNMGFALLDQQRPAAARDFFAAAIELEPAQANAYYGLGVASEALGDMPAALGAMRTFVHLGTASDPFVRRARAALWEWQSAASGRGRDGASDAEH